MKKSLNAYLSNLIPRETDNKENDPNQAEMYVDQEGIMRVKPINIGD